MGIISEINLDNPSIQDAQVRDADTIAVEINTLTGQAQAVVLHYIIEIGRRLDEVKDMLPHGEWGNWLAEKVHYSQSTAENHIRIYKEYGAAQVSLFDGAGKSQTIMKLEYSKLLALIAVPKEERAEFAVEVDAEHISVRELQEQIRQLKQRNDTAERQAADAHKRLEEIERQEQRTLERLQTERQRAEKEAERLAAEADGLRRKVEDIEQRELGPSEIPENLLVQLRAEEDKRAKAEYKDKLKAANDKRKEAEKKAEEAAAKLQDIEAAAEKRLREKIDAQTSAYKAASEAAEQRAKELEKKLQLAGNAEAIKFNVLYQELQRVHMALCDIIDACRDTQQRAKLRQAMHAALDNMMERLDE